MKKIVCHILPYLDNVHLLKDNGLIPYYLAEDYDMEPWIVTYNREEKMVYNHKYLKGVLKFFLLGNTTSIQSNMTQIVHEGLTFLQEHAKNIDILYLFGLDIYNFYWISFYKYHNPDGKVYLKVDGSRHNVRMRLTQKEKDVLEMVDLISIESKEIQNKMKMFWRIPVAYIPNGFFLASNIEDSFTWNDKDDVILTVGRLGTQEKATEILLQAFALATECIAKSWSLKLVGPIQYEFEKYLEEFFTRFPELKERIIITGNIAERRDLEKIYEKAKIFCLSSRREGFPLVFPDALRRGCYIISTDIASAYDITQDETFGRITPVDDVVGMAYEFVNAVNNEKTIALQMNDRKKYAQEQFDWHVICKNIVKGLYGE